MFLFLALACQPKDENVVNYPVCVDTPTAVAADVTSSGGFSPNEIIAFSNGPHTDTLIWKDGSETPMALELTADANAAQWIDSVADYTGVTIDIGIECPARMEIPATLSFQTDDGAFTENFTGTLVVPEATIASMTVDLVQASLIGTFDPADWPTEDYDTLSMALTASFLPSTIGGTISGNAQKDNGCDDNGSCSASNETLDIASYGGLGG